MRLGSVSSLKARFQLILVITKPIYGLYLETLNHGYTLLRILHDLGTFNELEFQYEAYLRTKLTSKFSPYIGFVLGLKFIERPAGG